MANIKTAGKRNSAPLRAGWHGAPRKSRQRRLPISGTLGAPLEWSPTAADWGRLETAYGATFDSVLKAEIEGAVEQYLYDAPLEVAAPRADDFMKSLAKATRLAKDLGKVVRSFDGAGAIVARHWERYFPRDDGEYIGGLDDDDNALAQRIIALPSRRGRDHRDFRQVVHTFHSALAAAPQDVNSRHSAAFSEGDAWEHLIVDLARALRKTRLRATASKDPNRPVSPFVRFVTELQETFKDETLRRHPTPAGLSGAISLALRHLKPKRRNTAIPIS
jgi:hypothetical protein